MLVIISCAPKSDLSPDSDNDNTKQPENNTTPYRKALWGYSDELTLVLGEYFTVKPFYEEDNNTFTSSNPNVATIDANGLLTAISEGTTIISISNGVQSQECKVTVIERFMPEAVDLGLSVKWGSIDVGQGSYITESYFRWGEPVRSISQYFLSAETYVFTGERNDIMTKYNKADGYLLLQSEDDPATYYLGDSWRTPTKAEWDELFENCDVILGYLEFRDKYNSNSGISSARYRGWECRSKINGNSIVLTNDHYFWIDRAMLTGPYYYWTADVCTEHDYNYAYIVRLNVPSGDNPVLYYSFEDKSRTGFATCIRPVFNQKE